VVPFKSRVANSKGIVYRLTQRSTRETRYEKSIDWTLFLSVSFLLIELFGIVVIGGVLVYLKLVLFCELVFLSLRGSRRAASVLCAFSLLAALMMLKYLWFVWRATQSAPIPLIALCLFYFVTAFYLWFSPRTRRFFNSDFLWASKLSSEASIQKRGNGEL
jgi:hypothetical protein